MKMPFMDTLLPIDAVLDDLQLALRTRHEVVLEAPPGAGKTTRVPLALLDEPWLAGKKILLLEPRRIAAKSSAYRMAQTLGESVGQTVGYRMRLDHKVSRQTRLEVITEGVLTRLLQQDCFKPHHRQWQSRAARAFAIPRRTTLTDYPRPRRLLAHLLPRCQKRHERTLPQTPVAG